jgi:hypothetical protein
VRPGVVQGSQKDGVLGKGKRFARKFGDPRRSRRRRTRLRLLAGYGVVACGQREYRHRANASAAQPAHTARSACRAAHLFLANDPQLHGLRPSLRRAILLRRILRSNFGSIAAYNAAPRRSPLLKGNGNLTNYPRSGQWPCRTSHCHTRDIALGPGPATPPFDHPPKTHQQQSTSYNHVASDVFRCTFHFSYSNNPNTNSLANFPSHCSYKARYFRSPSLLYTVCNHRFKSATSF